MNLLHGRHSFGRGDLEDKLTWGRLVRQRNQYMHETLRRKGLGVVPKVGE